MMKTAAWASWGLLLASVLDASARDVSVPVAYEAPRDGYVSLALQAPSGESARSLLYAQPVKAGRQNVMWDGTDDLGRVCPTGDYSVRGIFFDQPPSLKYRMTVGRSGNPPYRTPDGKGDWGANLGQGTGIATNHDSVMMDDTGIYVELMGNRIHEENGKLYTLVNDTGCAVHEVDLPAFIPLAATSVRLSRDEAASAKPWDPDGPDPSFRPTFTVTRRDEPRHWPMKLDGEADGREGWFDGRTCLMILFDGQRLVDVRALYDEHNLYLHYDIFTPTSFANVGTELPLCPFVSGAYVDFCVAPDWRRPQREKPQAGDARIILARVAGGGTDGNSGGNFAQGYWPVLPGADTKPTVIRSPAAETKFDRIGPVEGLQMMWKDHGVDGRSHLHRTKLEVYVPLAALGISGDPAGRSVGFDISVAVANQRGDRRERAMHWAGLSEGVVVDRPGSAELLPRTWGTLNFAPR